MKKRSQRWSLGCLLIGWGSLLFTGCTKESDSDNQVIHEDTTSHDSIVIPVGWKEVGKLKANNMIWGITSDKDGNLYAAGYFTNTAGYHYVARWDGTTWSETGSFAANSSIFALTADAAGNVYAVGDFTNGATPEGGSQYVAKWDGSQWSDIGGGGGTMLTADSVGNLYKGPRKWDGFNWSDICPVGTLNLSTVYAVTSSADGTIQYAGGDFQLPSGYRYIAKCEGNNCWSELGSLNANADIEAVVSGTDGTVYAAGCFTNGNLASTGYHYVAKWDGSVWTELGSLNANGIIYNLAIDRHTGKLYASGNFSNSQGQYYVAEWDGSSWKDLGDMHLSPTPIYVDQAGKLYSVVAGTDGKSFVVVVHE